MACPQILADCCRPGETLALVALGANLSSSAGPPAKTLCAALAMLAEQGARPLALSRFWRTPAYPAGSGPDYVNAAAVLGVSHNPTAILALLHRVEAVLGRRRDMGERWQARGIDLDLLAMGSLVLPDAGAQDRWRFLPSSQQALTAPEELILPHPRMQDRGFVLVPLAEIAPGWVHPRTGRSVAQMLAALGPAALTGMEPWSTASFPASA